MTMMDAVKDDAARPGFRIGEKSATFLVLQGIGEYDYVPLVKSA